MRECIFSLFLRKTKVALSQVREEIGRSLGGRVRTLQKIVFSILMILSTITVNTVYAQTNLSNTEIYAKCYAKISDMPVEMNSADYIAVAQGKLNPVTACMKLLDKAMFKAEGDKSVIANKSDVLSRSILRNFHQFHLSWFTSLHSSVGHDTFHMFADNNEAGLYITDALFGQKHYKTITTANYGLRGVRSAGVPDTYFVNTIGLTNTIVLFGPMKSTRPVPAPINNITDLSSHPTRVPVGPLIGLEPAPEVNIKLPEFIARATVTEAQLPSSLYEGESTNLTRHYGGGILGSPSLFLNNVEQYGAMDGGLKVHRRWANNIFYDVLCSSLPSLKETSKPVADEHKIFTDQKTELPFRGSKTCLTCHTTIDNLAHVARNVQIRQSSTNTFTRDLRESEVTTKAIRDMFFVLGHKPRKDAIVPIDSDNLYQRRKPEGSVTYIDFNGKLIDVPVEGLQQYGEVLALQDDIYACAAKRYYHFLTGLDVPLKKPSDTDKFASYHRAQVVALGKKLKSNGSLKTLVQDILNSPSFKARNPAEVGAK